MPIAYNDIDAKISLNCYADTIVYEQKQNGEKALISIRFGGYPEQVQAMVNALNNDAAIEGMYGEKTLVLKATNKKYTKEVTRNGLYSMGAILPIDEENGEECVDEENNSQQKSKQDEKSKNAKRRTYIFCEEGNSDALFSEIDKKTAIPLVPEFKDYIIAQCLNKKILVPLEVMSAGERFEAYILNLDKDEKEMEEVINKGLRNGHISIPNAKGNDGFDDIETVSQYLNSYGTTIANRIRDNFNPLFDPSNEDICDELKRINGNIKKNTGYTLYPAQLAVAESVKRRLDRSKVAIIVAECGSGKTKIGSTALAAHQKGKKTFNAVLCPSHMTKKWVRELEETLPNTKAAVVRSITDIDREYQSYLSGDESRYIVLSKERARDGYMRKPAVVYSRRKKAFVCPWCNEVIKMELEEDDAHYVVKADSMFFKTQNSENYKCRECHMSLWTALNPNDKRLSSNKWVKIGNYGFVYRDFAKVHLDYVKDKNIVSKIEEIIDNPAEVFVARGAYHRHSLSDYIAQHIKQLDGVILDELHQFKGDSGQGAAMETLIGCSKKVVGMTATLINGYSSGLFYLLYRIVPHLMRLDNKKYNSYTEFNREYGVTQKVYKLKKGDYNKKSRSHRKLIKTRQRPGVSPLVYSRFLIDCAVFLSLNDMGKHLPEYEEIPVKLKLRSDIKEEYRRIEESFSTILNDKDIDSNKLLSTFLSVLTRYPDQPYGIEPVRIDAKYSIEIKSLSSIEEVHEKDDAVLEIAGRKIADGGRVLIYTSWVGIDTQPKLKALLEAKGYKVSVLEPKIKPERREEWVLKEIEDGMDVLICNPTLVETGLDLNMFTTIIFYNVGYNLFTFRQASRRSWRINQLAARIEVYILYYEDVMQERAITLMASKLSTATLVEGNFTDEGLAAMSNADDMTSELAKQLTKGIKGKVEDVAAMYKQMAILKDASDVLEEDSLQYIIEAESVAVSETVVISISDKIKQAVIIANRMKGIREETVVKEQRDFSKVGEQLSLFDMLDMAS